MLESYHKLQPKRKPKTPSSNLLEKAINDAVNNYTKWLQACVSANGGHIEYKIW